MSWALLLRPTAYQNHQGIAVFPEVDPIARPEIDAVADQASRKSGYSDALKADYLQNWTPAQRPRRVPMVTGGFNTIIDDMRDKSKEMERQAMLRLLKGEEFDPQEAPVRVPVSAVRTASALAKTGGVLSTIGSMTPAMIAPVLPGE